MSVIRICAVVGAMLLASAGTAAAVADQAAAPDQVAASTTPGMPTPNPQAAPAPTIIARGEPGTTPSQIRALREGDNRLVTNGPIPDTPANRSRFGKPLSHAGKKTTPTGN